MHFLQENWWKILVCLAECAAIGKFLVWHLDTPPKNPYLGLRRPNLALKQGAEDDWEGTIVRPPLDAA